MKSSKDKPVRLIKTTVLFYCRISEHDECPIVLHTAQGNKVLCVCKCHLVQRLGNSRYKGGV